MCKSLGLQKVTPFTNTQITAVHTECYKGYKLRWVYISKCVSFSIIELIEELGKSLHLLDHAF